jgi:hypothetical protein
MAAMSEPSHPVDSALPRWSRAWIVQRVTGALLGQFNVPGWLLIIIAIFIGVPDWNSRVEFWLSVAQSSGGHMSMAAKILLWPYFAPALAVIGIVYLVVVNRFESRLARHPILPIVAWTGVVICFVAITLTVGYGAVEIYIRQEIAKGITGIPCGAPDDRPNQPPVYSSARQLTPDQIRILAVELSKIKDLVKSVQIYTAPGDNEAWSLYAQLNEVFQRSGINT